MQNVDYIVVGLGIGGLSFCEQLRKHDKSFKVFDHGKNISTVVSGGVFNPVVLKRFTASWNAQQHIEYALPFYQALSERLQMPVLENIPIFRILKNTEEQNNWAVASDKKELERFLVSGLIKNENPNINALFGFGKVAISGRISPSQLLQTYREQLQQEDRLISERFDHAKLQQKGDHICYDTISAKKIVFAEGVGAVHNPFFPKGSLIGNKGEYLIIEAQELELKEILKGPLFIIPLGNHLYKVGATYSRNDFSENPTVAAKDHMVAKLKQMILCEFNIVDQIAGIRPTTKDRRPLLGTLPENPNKAFLNGFGTRGIIMAPFLSKMLYKDLEEGRELPKEVNIGRFT